VRVPSKVSAFIVSGGVVLIVSANFLFIALIQGKNNLNAKVRRKVLKRVSDYYWPVKRNPYNSIDTVYLVISFQMVYM